MNKPFFKTNFWKILKQVSLIVAEGLLKKAKFNKTAQDSKNIDEVIDILK